MQRCISAHLFYILKDRPTSGKTFLKHNLYFRSSPKSFFIFEKPFGELRKHFLFLKNVFLQVRICFLFLWSYFHKCGNTPYF